MDTHKELERKKVERRKDKMNYKTLMFEEKISSFYFILTSLFLLLQTYVHNIPYIGKISNTSI
jgi:hypothetical protein